MPLDRKDSGSTWQGPQTYKISEVQPDAPWEPSDETDISPDQAEQEPLTVPTATNALHLGVDEAAEDAGEAEETYGCTEPMNQL